MFFSAMGTLIRLPDITEYLSSFFFISTLYRLIGRLPLITTNHFAGRVNNTSESSFVFNRNVAIPSYSFEWQYVFYQPFIDHFKNKLMDSELFNLLKRKIRSWAFLYTKST